MNYNDTNCPDEIIIMLENLLTFEINEITFDKGIKFILEKKNNVMLLQPISNNWLFSFRNSEIHHQRKQEEFDRFVEANFYNSLLIIKINNSKNDKSINQRSFYNFYLLINTRIIQKNSNAFNYESRNQRISSRGSSFNSHPSLNTRFPLDLSPRFTRNIIIYPCEEIGKKGREKEDNSSCWIVHPHPRAEKSRNREENRWLPRLKGMIFGTRKIVTTQTAKAK